MKVASSRLSLAPRYWQANVPFLGGLYRNALLFMGFFGLCALYVMPLKYLIGPVNINVFIPSILVILGCLTILGKRALTVTPFDYIFLAWLTLAVLSHLFANQFLYRTLPEVYLQTNLLFILTLGLTYRAFLCLTLLAPKIASKMFVCASMVATGGCVLLAIAQKLGPGKAFALRLGMQLSRIPAHVRDGVDLGRPTGVFDNPNVLGYVACIFAALVMGWAFSDLKSLRPVKTLAVLGLFIVAIVGVLTVQSRENAVLLCVMPLILGLWITRFSLDRRSAVVAIVFIAAAGFGLTWFVGATKSTYLTSITHQNLKGDQSFQERAEEFRKLGKIAEDIAPMGTGQSAANMMDHSAFGGYSFFDSKGIDSEWANIYLAFGVWGPLLLAWLYLSQATMIRFLAKVKVPEARMITVIGVFLLAFNLLLTVAAVRVDKYETGLFTFQILGVMSAWWLTAKREGLTTVNPGPSHLSGQPAL